MKNRSRAAMVAVGAAALLLSAAVAARHCEGGSGDGDGIAGEDPSCDAFEPADVAFCRRRPSWSGREGDDGDVDVRETCRATMGFDPNEEQLVRGRHPQMSSTFGSSKDSAEDDADYDALPVMERPLMKRLAECMNEARAANNENDGADGSAEDATEMPRPSLSKLHRRQDGLPVMGIVSNALNEEEARSVHALSKCLKRHAPTLFERRRFEQTYEGGGNDVVYMAGFLQLLVPGVAVQLRRVLHLVWKEARWNDDEDYFMPIDVEYAEDEEKESAYSTKWWPDPMDETVGIRTTEHLSYDRWGALGYHEDTGSDYTVLVALSDASDYEGGEFSFFPEYDNEDRDNSDDDARISLKPERLSAIVFLSNFRHGVEEIRTPGRTMFANEFWRYGDVPVMQQRPRPEHHVFGDPMNSFELDEDLFGSEDEDDDDDEEDSWDEEEEGSEDGAYSVY